MRRFLLATASSLTLIGTASAADLPTQAPVYTKAPAYLAPSWTGPYAGLNIGAIRTRTDVEVSEFCCQWFDARLQKTGVTLGGQIGHNWQRDNFVFGLEADLNWVDARASRTAAGMGVSSDLSSRLNWYGTVRARAGILLAPPTLLYATGGLAVAGIKNRAFSNFAPFDIRTSGTRTGWTAGAGIEHQFGHNYSVKAELLYMDFGSKSASHNPFGTTYYARFKNTAVVGRLGVNVRW